MNKALDLLEQHCQWLAIALGGLFLAWSLYAYVLFAPVTVQANGKTLTPGDVDDTVNALSAQPLKTQINSQTPELPPAGQVNLASKFVPTLKGTDAPAVALRPDWVGSQPKDMTVTASDGPNLSLTLVTALPVTPPSDPLEIKSARVYHGDPVPAGQQAPQPQPGQAVAGHDLSYVRLTYRISPEEMVKDFQHVNISPQTQTAVEAVKLMRQEQQADGTWGSPVEVKPINNGAIPQTLPDAGYSDPATQTFHTWAEGADGQQQILRPAFYSVIYGEGPWDPSSDDLLPKYDPVKEAADKKKAYEDKKAADKAAADAKRAAAHPTGPSGPPGGMEPGEGGPPGGIPRGGAGRGRGGHPVAQDPQRPADLGDLAGARLAQGAPPPAPGQRFNNGLPPGYPPNIPGMPGQPGMPPMPDGVNPDGSPNAAATPGAGMPNAGPMPAPNFAPAVTPAFIGWAFDETVVEGHTYRYQVLYALKNPLGGTQNIADPKIKLPDGKSLTEEAVIWSTLDDNAWSQPIEVKPTAEYYLAQNNWQSQGQAPNQIKFTVFKWAKGKWQQALFSVSPGDKIGDVENGIDFGTNTTVVDVRFDSRVGQNGRAFVLLLTADGRLVERQPTTDRESPRMHQLIQAIQQANQTAQPNGAPGAPGTPPAAARGGDTPGGV